MAKRIKVAEEKNSLGQQMFVFSLPNGSRLTLEFCAHFMEPHGDACCAVASLISPDGTKIPLEVGDGGPSEPQLMQRASLWFANEEDNERIDEMVTKELDSTKEALAPLIDQIKKSESHKHN